MRISFWDQANTHFSQKYQQNSPCVFPGLNFTIRYIAKNPLSPYLKQNQKATPSYFHDHSMDLDNFFGISEMEPVTWGRYKWWKSSAEWSSYYCC